MGTARGPTSHLEKRMIPEEVFEGQILTYFLPESDGQDAIQYRMGSGGTVEIFDIVVNTTRCVGKGRRLIQELEKLLLPYGMKRLWAITRQSNAGAQIFYQKAGFEFLGLLQEFYMDEVPENAFVYGKKYP